MRYIISFGLAIGVTFLLLWGMQTLIAGGNDAMSEPPRGRVLDFIRLKQDEAIVKKDRKPAKPQQPRTPPPQNMQPQIAKANPNASASNNSFAADIQADLSIGNGLRLGSSDGEYLPIVKVAPIYPRRAQSRGIQGYVIVEFTVTANGSVRDPVVIKAVPENIFDRAAMAATLKFKYKPRVIDGVPQEVAGVQNKITFQIDG
ncbi:protein TonB [Thalassotalea sp. 42_200_T64]|nr:protein TonB [Thalassotalea sp. 42_200_T64]